MNDYKLGFMYRMASVLELIVRDAKVAFVVAKHDGQLEAAEVVQIAVQVSQKVHALSNLNLAEKEAMVLLCLKKGLSAANGLHGLVELAESSPAGLAVAEAQILSAAVAAANVLRAAAPQLFAPLKNGLAACLPFCYALVALDPKDTALVQEALGVNAATVLSNVVSILESVAESDVKKVVEVEQVQVVVEHISPPNVPEVEPSPEASS